MDGLVDPLQRREERAFVEVLAPMQVGETDSCAERRSNRFSGDDCPGTGDLRLSDIEIRTCPIHFLLRGGKVLMQGAPAIEYGSREGGLRFLRFLLRFFDRHIERHQHRTGLNDLAGREPDLADRAGKLVAERDRPQRQHGPDRRGGLMVLDFLRHGHRHGFHGLRLMPGRSGRFLERPVFPHGESRTHCHNDDQHQ